MNMLNEPVECWYNERYLENCPPINKADAKYLLCTLNKVFKERDILFMPMYGTLLGMIRENDFISHDCDMDTLIFSRDKQKVLDLIPSLKEYGIEMYCYVLPWIFTVKYNTARCDIDVLHDAAFPFCYRYCLIEEKYIQKNFFEQTEEREFLGDSFTVPKNPEKLLTYFYGKNWRIPSSKHARLESKVFFWRYASRFYGRIRRYIKRHLKKCPVLKFLYSFLG